MGALKRPPIFLAAALLIVGLASDSALHAEGSTGGGGTIQLQEGTDDHFCRKPDGGETPNLYKDKDFYYCAAKALAVGTITYDILARESGREPALVEETLLAIEKGTGLDVARDRHPEILFIIDDKPFPVAEAATLLTQRQVELPSGVATMFFSGSVPFFDQPRPHRCVLRSMQSPHIPRTVLALVDTRVMQPVDVIACAKHAVFVLLHIATPSPTTIVRTLGDYQP